MMNIIELAQVTSGDISNVEGALRPLNPDLSLVQISWNIVLALFDIAIYGFLLALLIAGVQMLFSGGQEEKMATGKKNITYAIIGLFIVFFGHLAITYIQRTVGDVSTVSISQLVANVFEIVLAVAGAGFLLMLLFAGFLYLTAGGNDEQLERAKKQITNAIIGIALTAFAFAIGRLILLMIGII